MAQKAYRLSEGKVLDWTANAAYSGGDVIQLRNGLAGVVPQDVASGDKIGIQIGGLFRVAKTASKVILPGSRMYFDQSANKANVIFATDTRDFFLGTAWSEEAAASSWVDVLLNEMHPGTINLGDGYVSVPVSTAGNNWDISGHREGVTLAFDTTLEAQKLDALSIYGTNTASLAFAEALICINTNGDDAAADFNVGLASGTHATDADSIAESLFCHIDGASLNILLESDDGTTEVAATDTTVDAVAGTPFLVQWDLRNLADIQAYIDGVNVLPASVFKLDAATGPLKLLAHIEKTSNDSPGSLSVMRLRAWTATV